MKTFKHVESLKKCIVYNHVSITYMLQLTFAILALSHTCPSYFVDAFQRKLQISYSSHLNTSAFTSLTKNLNIYLQFLLLLEIKFIYSEMHKS